MRILTSAKVILFGEYAVLLGYHGVACTIDLTCSVDLVLSQKDRVVPPEFRPIRPWTKGIHRAVEHYSAKYSATIPLGLILDIFRKTHPSRQDERCWVRIDSQIPQRKGVGSSSALSVGFSAALYLVHKRSFSSRELSDISNCGDSVFHGGYASGIDSNAVVYGGAVLFQNRLNEDAVTKMVAPELSFLLIDTGHPTKTAKIVPEILPILAKEETLLTEIESVSLAGWRSLKDSDFSLLAKLIGENGFLLEQLLGRTNCVKHLSDEVRRSGYRGVKVTGGAGGGSLLVFHPDMDYRHLKRILSKKQIDSVLVHSTNKGVLDFPENSILISNMSKSFVVSGGSRAGLSQETER